MIKAGNARAEVGFIDMLASSRFIPYEMHPYAPERIAMEYKHVREEFEAHIEDALDPLLQ